jgi:hypothetical protein
MHVERRRAERDRRQSWRIAAVCAVRNTVGDRIHLGQSEDIGPGGITLRRPCDLPIQPETAVSLTFDLPGTRTTVDVDGLVVSDRRSGAFRRTGIRFTGPSSRQLAALAEFCRRRA